MITSAVSSQGLMQVISYTRLEVKAGEEKTEIYEKSTASEERDKM